MQKTDQVFLRPRPDLHLHRDQIRVVNVLRGQSKCDSIDARAQFEGRVSKYAGDITSVTDKIVRYIAHDAPLIVHVNDHTVKILLDDTHYRSIFEINVKGDVYLAARRQWESDCFARLYDGQKALDRPKYGALNLLNCPRGQIMATAYGAWHFVLKPHVRDRTTVASGDTAGSRCLGVLDYCIHVLAAISDDELQKIIDIVEGRIESAGYRHGTVYREIQIHGDLDIARDIESLNIPADASRRESALAEQFGTKFGITVNSFAKK